MFRRTLPVLALLSTLLAAPALAADSATDVWESVTHHFAENQGVKIHYASVGEGPVVLFVHGFPDFWYSWHRQMAGLEDRYRAVALDLRGYNQSDKPQGKEHYLLEHLVADVKAVIDHLGGHPVNLVGHDWGGAISWRFAVTHPGLVKNLVILNLTHPRGYAAVLANPTPEQLKNTQYARDFAQDGSHQRLNLEQIAFFVAGTDERDRARYRQGLTASDPAAMVAYYQANYGSIRAEAVAQMPNLQMPVLQFHGLKDTAVDKDGLKGTWDWVNQDYTLVAIPSSGHWVQREAADLVTSNLRFWLDQRNR
jgi:pimeloyl-ACP methyl ester carboxylesterase